MACGIGNKSHFLSLRDILLVLTSPNNFKGCIDLWGPGDLRGQLVLLLASGHLSETHKGPPEVLSASRVPVSQSFLVLCIQVTNTPETPRKPSQPPPRPPPDYLHGGTLPAPLSAHLSRAARNSLGAGSQVERSESSRRPPPSRPVPPAPNCILSQVSGLLETLGWGCCF